MDYSNLFQYFLWMSYVPTLVENSKFFCVLCKIIIMIGEPTHYLLKIEIFIMFIVSYVQPVTKHYEPRTVQKAPQQ